MKAKKSIQFALKPSEYHWLMRLNHVVFLVAYIYIYIHTYQQPAQGDKLCQAIAAGLR